MPYTQTKTQTTERAGSERIGRVHTRHASRPKIAYENSLCMLFANDARRQLHNIFTQFGDNIKTVRQLRNAVLSKFFDLS